MATMSKDERVQESIEKLLELLQKANEAGLIDLAEDIVDLVPDSLSYMTDPRILTIGANISFLLHVLEMLNPTMITVMFNNFAKALNEEMTPETFQNPPKVGLMGLMRMLGDPDVQRALGFIFLFLKAFGKSIAYTSEDVGKMMPQMEKQLQMIREKRKKLGIS